MTTIYVYRADPFDAALDAIETYAAAQAQYEAANGEHAAVAAANRAILAASGPVRAELAALVAEGRRQAAEQLVALADQLDDDCAGHGVASAISPGLRNAADVLTGESWLLKRVDPAKSTEPAEQEPASHARGCCCGWNDAGQRFIDLICRGR